MQSAGKQEDTCTMAGAADAGGRVVGQHPLPSALMAFGLGVGTGLLAAAILGRSRPWEDETFARRVSHQVQDKLTKILPEAMAKHLS